MIIAPQMGLTIWNLSTDEYDSSELADNWARVDEHDHSPGKGVQVDTEGIADGAITAEKLDPAAIPVPPTETPVDTSRLVDLAVTTAKIADDAVTTDKLATLPAAKATRVTTQAIGTTLTAVTFTAAAFDLATMWTVANRLIFTVAGTYIITGNTVWNTGADTQYTATDIVANGVTFLTGDSGQAAYTSSSFGFVQTHSPSTVYRAAAGEYVQLQCVRDFSSASITSANLCAAWIGP